MRFVTAHNLKPGMLVGRHFYNNSMCIMLRKGVTLTASHIRTIRRVNIAGIYIDDEQTRDIIIKPLIDDDLKLKFATEVKTIFSLVKSKVKPDPEQFEDMVKNIIDHISKKKNHVVSMFDLKSFDDYTFQHSIDVCILSAVLGKACKLSEHQINNLALSAVYHDVGKMLIDPRIINKRSPLTEEERATLREHPALGADFVKKLDIPRSDVLDGILQHHERYDGEGYPRGFSGEQIGFFGRIIALADVFDAITSKRAYVDALLPSEAVEYIMANAGRHFDMALTKQFVNNISAYPVGTTVRLSNGMTGVVAENYRGYTMRPLIKILTGDTGEPARYINLRSDSDAKSVTIVAVLS